VPADAVPAPAIASPAADVVESVAQAPAAPAADQRSELVMIETSTDKVQSRQTDDVTETAPASTPRRKRASVVVPDEPLVMVETQK